MFEQKDYSLLDRPGFLRFVFHPRKYVTVAPQNSKDYFIPVDDGVSIGCRYYVNGHDSPNILFFHGNGEVVSDYDEIAALYNAQGINLFVADYRGYGASGGVPTFASMVGDSHLIFKAFLEILRQNHDGGDIFVMGRSLGSMSAIELASCYQEQIKGLIIESGFASMAKLTQHLGFPGQYMVFNDDTFPNMAKIRSITVPTLFLHGECDSIIPVTEARDLFENAAARTKQMVVIRGAGHNDIMMVGMEKYFKAIREFVLGDRA